MRGKAKIGRIKLVQSNDAIQYRPGRTLGRRILNFASRYEMSTHDAARDLAALALLGLDASFYPMIAELTDTRYCPLGFIDACNNLDIAFQAAYGDKRDELTRAERAKFVQKTLEQLHKSLELTTPS